jgi:hypothetical protein
MLAAVPAGESPAGGECPNATVVISGDEKGDRLGESPEVNVSAAGDTRSDSPRRLATRQAVANVNQRSLEMRGPLEANGGTTWERRACPQEAKARVVGDGIGRKSSTRSPGSERTACREGTSSESTEPLAGRLGESTAKASRISRKVKSRCAGEWGRWGRLSDDGPGQNNPDRSEGPWGRAAPAARMAVLKRATPPAQNGDSIVESMGTKGGGKPYGVTHGRREGRRRLKGRP